MHVDQNSCPNGLAIRLLDHFDSIPDLTRLINLAYKSLADMGLKYVATWQGDDITLKRIKDVECWVGEIDGKIIATVCLRDTSLGKGAEWYEREDVASFNQFAVHPEFQGKGIGSMMLDHIEDRARELGASELAFDTAEPAEHLIRWYSKRGYREVGKVDWDVTNYISVIMSKTL